MNNFAIEKMLIQILFTFFNKLILLINKLLYLYLHFFLHKTNILSNFFYFFIKKQSIILIIFLLIGMISFSQITAPYAVNIAGNQVTRGIYAIEWSVGESAVINIMDNSDQYVFTNGLLQYNVENQTETNLVASFLTNEVRVYPNPVRNELYINILHASKGNDLIELFDEKGAKLKEKIVVYNGMGALEIWSLVGLKAGQYFINIRHTNPLTGRLIKRGAYKITKIN